MARRKVIDKLKRKKKRSSPFGLRKKVCRFCTTDQTVPDYKDAERLRKFVTENGKIIPRRVSGNCAKHQRPVVEALKRARYIALLGFTAR